MFHLLRFMSIFEMRLREKLKSLNADTNRDSDSKLSNESYLEF